VPFCWGAWSACLPPPPPAPGLDVMSSALYFDARVVTSAILGADLALSAGERDGGAAMGNNVSP